MQIIHPLLATYRTYANMTRVRKILNVLFKNGLGFFFGKLSHLVGRRERHAGEADNSPLPARVRKVLEELGPVYVKLGQMLSTRPDLIGQDFATELEKLQDRVTPIPFEKIRAVLEQELHAPLTELFADFEQTPAAAASLAQGHRARLHDGTRVFVKVLRPGVLREIKADMNVLLFLAEQFHENNPELRFLMLPHVVRQFRSSLLEEVNYTNERGNIRRFAQQFQGNDALAVPTVYPQYCTEHVLVMEEIAGTKIDQIDDLRNAGRDLTKLSETVTDLTLKQIFTYGFFHADPHPGNIHVLEDGRICYLDFGLCGRLSREERMLFCRLIVSILERNEQHAAQLLLRLCDYEEEPDADDLENTVGEFIDKYFYGPLSQLDVPEALRQLYAVCNRLHIAMKPHIYLMVKALGTIDGFLRKLNPDYDLEKQLRPALMQIAINQFSPHKSLHQRAEDFLDLMDLISRGPGGVRKFATKLLDGKFTVRQEFPQLEEYLRTEKRLRNRQTAAILTVGILLNSTLLLAWKIPPLLKEVSLLGAIGLLVGILMAAALTTQLLRK